jgi:hypothetical protein
MDVFDNSDLKQTYKKIKDFVNNMPLTDDAIVPITYLIQALYPNAYKNLQENFNKQYTLGYLQAKQEYENNENNAEA